ncbi:MAG TPA: sugar phosphorylase [Anaerolineales bacterium]|nr:sugar phosphorylase [Anaerolineales bacterium]
MTDLLTHLTFLYGADSAPRFLDRVQGLIAEYRKRIPARPAELTERDSILITYGDQVQLPGEKPLQTLGAFCDRTLNGVVSGIHILPFYPWTSDDGFSVKDYRQVDPALGDWDDISAMQPHFRLMFDGVINHISSQSAWFQAFLKDDPRYSDYFIVVEGTPDLSKVVRPRALPLLTTFPKTPSGEKRVWTTFSDDQIDLNYQNPEVLLEILDILLMYVERGATLLRLDAIAYLWKEIGTSCIHLPQTHHVIQFLRAVLDEVAPYVHLITETNVPHEENISYFGDGTNEAQLVYNFALPPLILHTFQTGNAGALSHWAQGLSLPSDRVTFFNFLASHDGIGLNPARGILSTNEIDALVEKTLEHSGLVSYKHNADGSESPYEMNINYFDALSNPQSGEPLSLQTDRFIAAQAIMLSIIGVPGIYFHSLYGSRGWREGVNLTGRNRSINRQKFDLRVLESALNDGTSLRNQVFHKYARLLRARSASPAFDPYSGQQVIECGEALFGLLRISKDENQHVLCLHNISDEPQRVTMHSKEIFGSSAGRLTDLITGHPIEDAANGNLALQPYQTLWLRIKE